MPRGVSYLAAIVARFGAAGYGLDISVPAIEAAAYFVCAESLTNIAKHASTSVARIRIAHEHGRLTVVVADDGAPVAAVPS